MAAVSTSEEEATASMYDASDLGRLLFGCPSIDGLLDVIVQSDFPDRFLDDDEESDRWQSFIDLACAIRARRRQACAV